MCRFMRRHTSARADTLGVCVPLVLSVGLKRQHAPMTALHTAKPSVYLSNASALVLKLKGTLTVASGTWDQAQEIKQPLANVISRLSECLVQRGQCP